MRIVSDGQLEMIQEFFPPTVLAAGRQNYLQFYDLSSSIFSEKRQLVTRQFCHAIKLS